MKRECWGCLQEKDDVEIVILGQAKLYLCAACQRYWRRVVQILDVGSRRILGNIVKRFVEHEKIAEETKE